MKRCFVISPIGQPNSEVRAHADAVLEYIIEPALRELGIEAVRADRLAEPGLITEQMIAAILGYELCIVDLSGHNPNVFYELAMAQAAARPVVILKRAGESIPFDVKDYRLIEYDLSPRSMKTDCWIPVLKEQVQRVLAADYQPPRLLSGKAAMPSDGFRSYLINARSQEFGEAPRYHEVVQHAKEYCYLMGVSLQSWSTAEARDVLRALAARKVPVRAMIMDADHPGLSAMVNEHLPSEDLPSVQRQTERMAEYFLGLDRSAHSFQFRRLRQGMPHFQLIVTEETALVLQYMFSRGAEESPLQQFPGGSTLHRAFREEFEALWELNEPARATSEKSAVVRPLERASLLGRGARAARRPAPALRGARRGTGPGRG